MLVPPGVGVRVYFWVLGTFPRLAANLALSGSLRSAVCVASPQYTGSVYCVLSGKRVPQTPRLIVCVIDRKGIRLPFLSSYVFGLFLGCALGSGNTTGEYSLIYNQLM